MAHYHHGMRARIPDLWKAKEEDAPRLYQLFLAHLQLHRRHARMVAACRTIWRYAARGPGTDKAAFTFESELEALCALSRYKSAWRLLGLREEIVYGRRLSWTDLCDGVANPPELTWLYAPVLYLLKRFADGCALKERYLDYWFTWDKVRSYDMLFDVYNDDEEPSHRCRVTLWHFYGRLGKDLREWRNWEAFVNGFHLKLFRMAGVRRDELLANAGRLPVFFDRLIAIRNERTPTGITSGQSDLVESPSKVKKRQEATREQLGNFEERNKVRREKMEARLCELFPELRPE